MLKKIDENESDIRKIMGLILKDKGKRIDNIACN